ncbi:GntR family transcriptional regulator [Mycolicibacterium goodii]|uniref:GntR family transcriptional regulator n=1 Tax=Mycolicibacterium goodii TaxID=134601 RepID=UPI001BDD17C3|nr:GntR family transcriptional regulator [Mycolicibacterium goodii]MBU8814542.1 GntR family transcriptional regulator [Mycolicibacterium goodii]
MTRAYAIRTELDATLAELQAGDPVPAERELAVRFGVARETVRQALHELLVAGRIERRGRGTVVARPKLVQPLSLGSYTEGAQTVGRTPGRLLVTREIIDASAELATDLGIATGAPVLHLERVLLADDQSIGLESTYLAAARFGHLEHDFDPTTSLYAAIRACGVEFSSATERIETALPTPREAALLECTTALPMFLLNRRSIDTAGTAIEVVRALYRGDRVAFEAVLTAPDRN